MELLAGENALLHFQRGLKRTKRPEPFFSEVLSGLLAGQILPVSSSMISITATTPRAPLGP